MQLFLHIILSDKPVVFEMELRTWLKKELPGVTYFDVDQRSEDLVIRTAMEAIEKADNIYTYLEGSTSNPQSIFKIIKKLQKVDDHSICVINNSNNQLISKLSRAFGKKWHNAVAYNELKKSIADFFTSPA